MLVLNQRCGEEIVIDGNIRITVVGVQGDRVRFGIIAPKTVSVDLALDPVDQIVALFPRQAGGKKLHDARIGVHPRKRLAIPIAPAAQDEAIGLNRRVIHR